MMWFYCRFIVYHTVRNFGRWKISQNYWCVCYFCGFDFCSFSMWRPHPEWSMPLHCTCLQYLYDITILCPYFSRFTRHPINLSAKHCTILYPRKQTISIYKTVSLLWYQLHLQFLSWWQLLYNHYWTLLRLGVGYTPISGTQYTFIPISSSRKTSVEG